VRSWPAVAAPLTVAGESRERAAGVGTNRQGFEKGLRDAAPARAVSQKGLEIQDSGFRETDAGL
jgi:hypothetical protein